MKETGPVEMSAAEEARLIRYLLIDLPQDESDQIEDRYFQDDACFEALAALETQLVRDWLAGSLSPQQAKQFEARMQTDAALREHVAVVEALTGQKAKPATAVQAKGTGRMLRNLLFMQQAPATLALAACSVLLVASVVTAALSYRRVDQLQARVAALAAQRSAAGAAVSTAVSDPVFSLLAGVLRGGASRPALSIPAGARMVHLQTLVTGRSGGTLRMSLRNADGGSESWSAFIAGKDQIEVSIPADLLHAGDYILSCQTAAGEEIESWPFRVLR